MSKKIISQLEEISVLGKEIVQLAYAIHGTGWNYIGDEINCYVAVSRNHRVLQIDKFEIAYFNPVKFELRLKDIPDLASYVDRCKNKLEELKRIISERDVEESERLKRERIHALKKELSELEKQNDQATE